jgi:hypothetical protein
LSQRDRQISDLRTLPTLEWLLGRLSTAAATTGAIIQGYRWIAGATLFLLMLIPCLQGRFGEFAEHLVGSARIIKAAAKPLRLDNERRSRSWPTAGRTNGFR